MTDSTLKAVLVLDARTQKYKPNAHNLTAESAADLTTQLAHRNEKAQVVDQADRHRSSNPKRCKFCKQAAQEASLQPNAATENTEAAASQ